MNDFPLVCSLRPTAAAQPREPRVKKRVPGLAARNPSICPISAQESLFIRMMPITNPKNVNPSISAAAMIMFVPIEPFASG